ncbi:MAG TPA: 30S ribosomal protein S20 [Chthoniobacteraceae bacterium]|nr:30S ribosomal protein S20 [Chthoniobacteraceae bacterium]
MANTKSAAKRARQTGRRTLFNKRALTSVKTQVKDFRKKVATKDKAAAKASFQSLISEIDRAAKNGRIHKNAANRKKSRLNKALAALA